MDVVAVLEVDIVGLAVDDSVALLDTKIVVLPVVIEAVLGVEVVRFVVDVSVVLYRDALVV